MGLQVTWEGQENYIELSYPWENNGERATVRFRFKSDKRLRCQICRIFNKKTRAIAKCARSSGKRGEEEVHDLRREIQKLRALLKLVRCRLAGEGYKRQNCRLREAAQALSLLRDADVSLKSLQRFRSRQQGKVLHAVSDKLKATLLKRRAEVYHDEPTFKKKLGVEIEKTRRGFRKLRIKPINQVDVCKGIGDSYENGAMAYHTAERLRSKENLHEWRKQVKRLRHQLSLMEKILSPKFLKRLDDLKCLSDCLGDDHDLAILDEIAATEGLPLGEWKALSAEVAEERYHLQQSAFLVGSRLYAESRTDFMQEMEQEWE